MKEDMEHVIKFIAKWIIPIGFVQFIANKTNIFSSDSVAGNTFHRITENKNGAEVLIRKKEKTQ